MARRAAPAADQWRKVYGVNTSDTPSQDWVPIYNTFRDWWDQGMSDEELDYGMEYVGMPRLKNLMGQPLHPYFTGPPVAAPVETSGDPWASGIDQALAIVAGQDESGDEDLGFFRNPTDPWASGIDQALAIVGGQDDSNLGDDYAAPDEFFDKGANVADLTDGYGSQDADLVHEAEFDMGDGMDMGGDMDMGDGMPVDDTGGDLDFDVVGAVIDNPALLDGQPDEVLDYAVDAITEYVYEVGGTDVDVANTLDHVFGTGGGDMGGDGGGEVPDEWQPTFGDGGYTDDEIHGWINSDEGQNYLNPDDPSSPMDPDQAGDVTRSLEEVMADQMEVFDTQVAEETAAIDALVDAGLVDIAEAETLYNDTIDGIYNDFLADQSAVQAEYESMVASSATSRTQDREALMAELAAAGIDPSLVSGDLSILDQLAATTQGARGTYLGEVGRIGRMSDADRGLMSQGMFTGFRQDVTGAGRTEKAAVGRDAREGKRALEAMGLSADQMSEYLDLDPGALFASMVAGVDLPAIAEGRAERDWRTEERELGQDWQSGESAKDRSHAEAMQNDSQSFSLDMTNLQNTWQGSQNDLNRQLDKMRFFESISQFNRDLMFRNKQFDQDVIEFGETLAVQKQSLDDARREFAAGLSYDYYQTNQSMSQRDKDRNESIRQFDEQVEQWQSEFNLDLTQNQWKEIYDQKMIDIEVERMAEDVRQFGITSATGAWEFDQTMARNVYEFTETMAANEWQFDTATAENARQFGITSVADARQAHSLSELLSDEGFSGKINRVVMEFNARRKDWYDTNYPNDSDLRDVGAIPLEPAQILPMIIEDIALGNRGALDNEFGIDYSMYFDPDDYPAIEEVWDEFTVGTPVENWVPPTGRVKEEWTASGFDVDEYIDMFEGDAWGTTTLEQDRNTNQSQSHLGAP